MLVVGDLYHTGIVVEDLDTACKEATRMAGIAWRLKTEVELEVTMLNQTRTVRLNFCYSASGPHHLEFVKAIPDTIWQSTGLGTVHHLGFFVDDVAEACEQLELEGCQVVAAGSSEGSKRPQRFAMLSTPTFKYLEVVDRSSRARLIGDD